MSGIVDASVLLAVIFDEDGADRAEEILGSPCVISIVNFAEVLSKVAEHGGDPETTAIQLMELGILHQHLHLFEPLDERLAIDVAALRPITKAKGLGIGDRICIALGRALGVTVYTADRSWLKVGDLGVKIVAIRGSP